MPVLVKTADGLAENLPQEAADKALQAGTHELPFNDPQGNPVTAPLDQAQDLLAQGYSQPSDHQYKSLLDYGKYSSPTEQAKTFAEGALSAASFGTSSFAERMLGADPEAMRARKDINPVAHGAGEVAGLAGSAFIPGVGEANALRAGGEAAAAAAARLGLPAAESLVGRLGTAAIKNATETAMYQMGTEVSKMAMQDPSQTIGTAAADVGLSAVLGGATGAGLGAVKEGWNATAGPKVSRYLSALKAKAALPEVGLPGADAAMKAAEAAGVELSPEMAAAYTPEGKALYQPVLEGETYAGKKLRSARDALYENTQKGALAALGKTPEEVSALENLSQDEIGGKMKQSLIGKLKARYEPIQKLYEGVEDKYSHIDLQQIDKDKLGDKLSLLLKDYAETPHAPEAKALQEMVEDLGPLKTMKGLKKFQESSLGELASKDLWSLRRQVREVLQGSQQEILGSQVLKETPSLFGQYQEAQKGYSEIMKELDELHRTLPLKNYHGPQSAITNLEKIQNEDVFRRLLDPQDVRLQQNLEARYPETAQLVKDAHLDRLLSFAAKKAEKPGHLNQNALFNALFENKNAWSPELRKFALPAGAEEKLRAIKLLTDQLPDRLGPSGTARTADALMKHMPGGIMSVLAMMNGHGAFWGFLSGQLMRLVGREAPDAVKLGMLKFLGSGEPISAPAFKAAVDYFHAVSKGEALVTKAIKGVLGTTEVVLPPKLIPDHDKLKKLDSQLQNYRTNPAPLIDVGGKIPHYAPEHGQAMGQLASTAVNYLNSLRPEPTPMGPLGAPAEPSKAEMRNYERQLAIAQQPLMVMKHLKDATITPQDMQTFQTVYPGLYSRIQQKLMAEVIERKSKGVTLPYKTLLSMGIFMGQDLDSSTFQENIAFNQMASMGHAQSQDQMNQSAEPTQKGLSSINQANRLLTPMQAANRRSERA